LCFRRLAAAPNTSSASLAARVAALNKKDDFREVVYYLT
jgi:hypothetical protein